MRGVAVLVGVVLVASACVPGSPPPTTVPRVDPEIEAMLRDPEFVAQFGESEEERAEILAGIREYLDEWGSWGLDPAALEEFAAAKQNHDDDVAAAAAAEQERLDAEAAAERARLDELQDGPELEDLLESQTDGSEDFDYSPDAEHWGSIEGYAAVRDDIVTAHVETRRRVDQVVAELQASGELPALDRIPGYIPPQGDGDPLFGAIWLEAARERDIPDPTGACKDRAGGRDAPTQASLRPGTIYTPYQNTFAAPAGTPTHLGQLKTTMLDGKRHMIVEGHLGDLDSALVAPIFSITTWARARITIHTPDNIVPDHDGYGPFMKPWAPGTPVESGHVQVLCYRDDFGLPTGAPIRRAMFRAYVPMQTDDFELVEPVFQVKAAVSDNATYPTAFYGADMRTVHLGRPPLGHHSTFTNGGFGVTAGRGVIIDDNGVAADDLESTIRTPVANAVTNALSGLDDTSSWVLGKKNAGSNWGWFGFHINNSNPTPPNVDIEWTPTTKGGAVDDEHRLKGTISMNDWLIEGYASLPWASLGLIPCYFKMKVDWSASIYAAVDIHDGARTILQPDIEIGPVDLGVHSMFTSPVPLGCNSLYLFLFADRWAETLNEILPLVNHVMANQMQVQPNVQNVVPATIPIGGGQNMQTLFAGWNDTCAPYGCDGHRAGDMGMSWAGLEATGDLRFTDTLPVGATRDFPASYSPTTAGTANDRVRFHFGPQNEITDFSAWINPAVLNQMLRVMAEHGRLDLQFDPSTPSTARSAPIYLSTPIAPDKPLGLFVPHLEIDPAGPNLFAVDAFAAVGVDFNPATRKLVPAPVSPSDPGLGIGVWTLNCDSPLWVVCDGIPGVASDVLNWAGNTLLNPLLQNSIGQVTVPNTGSFPLSSVKILNEDGHLGIRASVGATQLRVWGDMNAATYNFDTYWEGLPGSGPVTYMWTIKDVVSGTNIFSYTGQQWQFFGFPTNALTPLNLLGTQLRAATATVQASRGGQTISASHTVHFAS